MNFKQNVRAYYIQYQTKAIGLPLHSLESFLLENEKVFLTCSNGFRKAVKAMQSDPSIPASEKRELLVWSMHINEQTMVWNQAFLNLFTEDPIRESAVRHHLEALTDLFAKAS